MQHIEVYLLHPSGLDSAATMPAVYFVCDAVAPRVLACLARPAAVWYDMARACLGRPDSCMFTRTGPFEVTLAGSVMCGGGALEPQRAAVMFMQAARLVEGDLRHRHAQYASCAWRAESVARSALERALADAATPADLANLVPLATIAEKGRAFYAGDGPLATMCRVVAQLQFSQSVRDAAVLDLRAQLSEMADNFARTPNEPLSEEQWEDLQLLLADERWYGGNAALVKPMSPS